MFDHVSAKTTQQVSSNIRLVMAVCFQFDKDTFSLLTAEDEDEDEAGRAVTPVEGFPEAQEDGPVQMAPVAAQLQDSHVPLLNVGVRLCLVVLQVKSSNW